MIGNGFGEESVSDGVFSLTMVSRRHLIQVKDQRPKCVGQLNPVKSYLEIHFAGSYGRNALTIAWINQVIKFSFAY